MVENVNEITAVTDCEDSSLSQDRGSSAPEDDSKKDHALDESGDRVDNQSRDRPRTISQRWTDIIRTLHEPLHIFLRFVTGLSAKNPRKTVFGMTVLALFLAVVGLSTNFLIDVDEDSLWTPRGSNAARHQKWIKEESGFKLEPRWFVLLFHFDGGNVLGQSQVQRMFDVLDGVRAVDGYDEMCEASDYVDNNGVRTCEINGPPQIWNSSTAFFQSNVTSDAEAIQGLSVRFMPDLFPVVEEVFYGYPMRDDNDLLTSATSYSIFIHFPHVDLAEIVEERALDVVLGFQQKWRDDPDSNLYVEVASERSFPDEFTRAIITDLPLGKCWKTDMSQSRNTSCTHFSLSYFVLVSPFCFHADELLYLCSVLQEAQSPITKLTWDFSGRRSTFEYLRCLWNVVYHWSTFYLHYPDATLHHLRYRLG